MGDDGLRRNAAGETLSIELLERSPAFDRVVVLPFVENLKGSWDLTQNTIEWIQHIIPIEHAIMTLILSPINSLMSLEPGSGLKQYFGSETADESVFNSMGLKSEGIDALIEHVVQSKDKESLKTSVMALDHALRAYKFWVPQWYNATHRVAYWDIFEHH